LTVDVDVRSAADDYVVVDTDVFIWLIRGSRSTRQKYGAHVAGKRIVLSFATVAELWRGAAARGYEEASRSRLRAAIEACIVVSPTDALTQEWARLTDEARRAGHPLGQASQTHDAWIAATARYYGVPLLTDNVRHFIDLPGLDVIEAE
jgi:predicted nucleic acid-binding protein